MTALAGLLLAVAACGPEARGNIANRCFTQARARIWLAPAPVGGGLVGISLRVGRYSPPPRRRFDGNSGEGWSVEMSQSWCAARVAAMCRRCRASVESG